MYNNTGVRDRWLDLLSLGIVDCKCSSLYNFRVTEVCIDTRIVVALYCRCSLTFGSCILTFVVPSSMLTDIKPDWTPPHSQDVVISVAHK